MLENVLAAERQAIRDYKKRSEQAAECGDKGLATHLETIVEDETTHYEETEKILRAGRRDVPGVGVGLQEAGAGPAA